MRIPSPRRGWLRIIASLVVAPALALAIFGHRYVDELALDALSPGASLYSELARVYAAVLLLPAVAWWSRRHGIQRRDWVRHFPGHAVFFAAFSAMHTTLHLSANAVLFGLLDLGLYAPRSLFSHYSLEALNDLILYSFFVIGVEKIDRLREARDREMIATQLEAKLARAQLENLHLKLQPHFLFNALNTISSIMYADVRAADVMMAKLAELLRGSLRSSDAQEVTLREEVTLLRHYLDVMRARFEERLTLTIQIDRGAEDALVPPLLLQPLAENAVRHGNLSRIGRGRIDVSARRDGESLLVEIADDGPGMREEEELLNKGIGLSSTAERLQKLYGRLHRFQLTTDAGGGLRVTVRLPFRTADGDILADES